MAFALLFAIQLDINAALQYFSRKQPALPFFSRIPAHPNFSRIAPLTSIRVDPIVPVNSRGWYVFGQRVEGDRMVPERRLEVPPNPLGGVRRHIEIIESKPGEIITEIKLKSWHNLKSLGEEIHEIGYGPNHKSVKILFVSLPKEWIRFTISMRVRETKHVY